MADPFTPKFVDLVCNYTATSGTGNFTLGPTLNGFSSFASALQPGDGFYYAAIGIDKPTEREVGRGTLQANGTISRDPVSGTKTNFSTGTKILTLVAAAEWFNAVQAGGSGSNAGFAATRTALGASAQRQSPMVLAEAGREGVFVFDGSNMSAKIAADAYQGIHVAPASDPTGASGAWVRKYDGPASASWFGVADGASNNAERIESIEAIFYPRAAHIRFPSGEISFNRGIVFKRPHRIEGAGQGTEDYPTPNGNGATVLLFPFSAGAALRFKNGPGGTSAGSSGAQRASLSHLRIEFEGAIPAGGTANYAGSSATQITAVSPAANFSNGQVVVLEGAGPQVAVQDRTVGISSGSNIATVTTTNGEYLGNPGVYVGQHIDIAGAGLPAGTTVTAWGSSSITLSNNATATVSAAAYTIKCPLVSEIQSGGGTSALTINHFPNLNFPVTGAALRHANVGVYATCTIDMTNVEVNAQGSGGTTTVGGGIGLLLTGITSDSSVSDNCQFFNCKFTGGNSFAGVVLQGNDAQVNSFFGCNFAGPKVGVIDTSLLGNDFYGCHWAFNVGIVVGSPSAQTKIVGGYVESGTSYIAPYSSPCVAYGTTSMHNGSGWSVVDTSLGYFNLGSLLQAQAGKFLNGVNVGGARPLRGEGNCNNSPIGRAATGVSLGNNGGASQAWIYCSTAADVLVGTRLWSKDLEFYHGDVPGITMTFRATGMDLNAGKDLRLNGTTVIDSSRNGSFAGVTASGNIAVTGTISASNISGTNTGDQFTSIASGTIIGRSAAGTGPASALSSLPAAVMPAFSGGDVTSSAGSLALAIGSGAVTYAKMQNVAASRLIGNPTGSAAAPAEISVAGGLSFSGTTLTAAGPLTPSSVAATGAVTSSGGGLGYATGAGGAVTQATSKSTGVTLNKLAGQITMNAAALAAAAIVEFTVTNSQVAATDTINLNLASGAATSTAYRYWVSGIAAGSFKVAVENRSGGSLSEATVLNFAVVKAVNA